MQEGGHKESLKLTDEPELDEDPVTAVGEDSYLVREHLRRSGEAAKDGQS